MFVELLKAARIGTAKRLRGSVVEVPEDLAKRWIRDKSARFASGPEKLVDFDPEEAATYTGAKPAEAEDADESNATAPARRGPGRPRKDA